MKTQKKESLEDEDDSARRGGELGGFSVLFNFKDKDVQFQSTDGKIICRSNEVYDFYEKICRQIRCQEGQKAVNGTCVVSGLVYADRQNQLFPNGTLHYTVSFYVLTELPLQIKVIKDLLMVGPLFEQAYVVEIRNVSALPGDASFRGIKWESGQDLKQMVKIHVENVQSLAEDIHLISHLAQQLVSKFDPMIVDIILQNFHSESDLFCSYGTVMRLTNITLESLNGTLYAADSYKYYTLESVAFVLGLKSAPPDLQEILVCGIPLKCDPVVYNLTDFIQEDGNLRNLYSGVILENTSFFIAGDEVLSCHNFTQSGPQRYSQIFFKYDRVQDILTYVTSGVSMVSLLITLIVYSLFPELRNLPGRLTMSLCATLLLAQTLLLLIHLPTGWLCQALAIILHFSWLCTFMWMTVLSLTLARTFTSKGLNSLNQNIARTHGFLSLCASGIPLLIVTTSVLLDFLELPNIYIGYGAQGICWIANPPASLLVFGVPLALMLLVNVVAFIVTLCNIEKSLKLSENITSSKKDRAKVFIYGKLFVIMGVSWCTSFVAAFANVSILWYMFIILNGLQGFYIFVSFVCTDRVKRLLQKKFTGSSTDTRTTSAITSSTEIKSQKTEKNNI
ncbi:probable G-protein coupled receptor Mth-like 10 [Haliotis asinina]|uniref:probable G-protein coupled receptor Mth-like 10 n=1 Tax=Haliotis asinina TaxID=109174 RepID=UPI003531B987